MNWATAAISAGSKTEAFALKNWLDEIRELRGRSDVVVLPTEPGYQGGVTDVLTVALGSGGAAALLVNALPKWLAMRGKASTLKVKFTREGGMMKVEVEVDQTRDSTALIKEILSALKDGDGAE